MKNTVIDETGKRYGRLTVLSRADNTKHGLARWVCRCDCGNTVTVIGNHLRRGDTLSCGCFHNEGNHRTHGKSHSRVYGIWRNMLSRCENENGTGFEHYGGRGISVCEEWRNFDSFYKWANESGYSDSLTIDRIDVNKGYYPDNCRWIPFDKQGLNKTNSVILSVNGISKTVSEWANELHACATTMYHRKKRGWSDDRIINAARAGT